MEAIRQASHGRKDLMSVGSAIKTTNQKKGARSGLLYRIRYLYRGSVHG